MGGLQSAQGARLDQENRQLREVSHTFDRVLSSFKKMGEMVTLHDEMFSDIEMNASHAQENVERGRQVLQKIYQDVSSNRPFIVKMFAVVTLIALVLLLLK